MLINKNDLDNDIVSFYNMKINDILTSFFIKLFIKLKESYERIKDFQIYLHNNCVTPEIEKALTSFDIYIDKKYSLTLDEFNTAIYIYIKESLQKLLRKKITYEKSSSFIKTLFYKCFKNIACDLYEHPHNLNTTLQLKSMIGNTIYHTVYDMIPFDYTIHNYDNEIDDKKTDSVKEHFYSHSSKSHDKSEKKEEKLVNESKSDTIKKSIGNSKSKNTKGKSIESSDIDHKEYYNSSN